MAARSAELRYSIHHYGVMDVHVGKLVDSLRRLREIMGDATVVTRVLEFCYPKE
jgi:hypothetical protein